MRFVAVALGVLLFGTTAHAQAFKPRGGAKTTAPAKSKPAKKHAAKTAPAADSDDEDSDEKPAKKSATKSRGAKKGSRAAREGRPDDLTPGPAGKHDPDFVLITDDDDFE